MIKDTVSTLCLSIPAYRNIVDKILHVPQALENINTVAPSLDDDPVAIGSNCTPYQGLEDDK